MSKEKSEVEVQAAPGEAGYKPFGKVVELASNAKFGMHVLMDDKHVWKEPIKAGKKGE